MSSFSRPFVFISRCLGVLVQSHVQRRETRHKKGGKETWKETVRGEIMEVERREETTYVMGR